MASKKSHHRRGPRGTSLKTLGLAAAAGVASVVGLGYAQTKIDFFRDRWYAAPAALAGGAFLLSRKMPTVAIGLAAAAAIFGYIGYKANADAQAKAGEKSPSQAAGMHDAGAVRRMAVRRDSGLFDRSQAGSMQGPGAPALLFKQAGVLLGPASRDIRTRTAAGLQAG